MPTSFAKRSRSLPACLAAALFALAAPFAACAQGYYGNGNYNNYGNGNGSGNNNGYGNGNGNGYGSDNGSGNGGYGGYGSPQGGSGGQGTQGGYGGQNNPQNGRGTTNGPTTLQQQLPPLNLGSQGANGQNLQGLLNGPPFVPPYVQGEFEQYIQSLLPPDAPLVRRLGADLMTPSMVPSLAGLPEPSPIVPDDYVVVPGDTLHVSAWGSVDADMLLVVDRGGRIVIPHVGAITVAGVRAADLASAIKKQALHTFRTIDVAASIAMLRAIQVYVTGYVAHPGVYSVSNLSTLSNALVQAGGPSPAGSFRAIQVQRKGQPPIDFDLYDLVVRGRRNSDIILQPDDVVHVGPIGSQVALVGSVNQPSVVELKGGETLGDVLALAGGFSSVADISHIAIEKLGERTSTGPQQVPMPAGASLPAGRGDIVHVFSAVDAQSPIARQNRLVVVEGEVAHPGQYLLPPGSSLQDAVTAAGGMTPKAYVFGTELTRERVRKEQEMNYDKAVRDLENDLTRNAATARSSSPEDAASATAKDMAIQHLILNLHTVRPTGRVVLQVAPGAQAMPPVALENGDRINVPAMPTTVGVFGSVFTESNFVYAGGRTLQDYLDLAGGPKRGADKSSAFVVRSNGSVISNQQNSYWLSSGNLVKTEALPGDTIFVPEDVDKSTFVQSAKDWTQIIYQLGLGLAAAYAVTK